MNASPYGECLLYYPSFTNGLEKSYTAWVAGLSLGFYPQRNDWSDISKPFSAMAFKDFFADVAVHEICHTTGLVDEEHLGGLHGAHNNCSDGLHVMDPGGTVYWPMHLRSSHPFSFKSRNKNYLKFILPRGNQ